MELVFTTGARFERSLDGKIYSVTDSFNMDIWNRYLAVYNHLYIIARVGDSLKEYPKELLAESDKVTFICLPCYKGINGYLKERKRIYRIVRNNIDKKYNYICRVPGIIGSVVSRELRKNNIPYGVEVVGDPWTVFSFQNIRNILSPFLRMQGYLSLRKVVRGASAALYVTANQLQNRYPARKGVFTINASDVNLPSELICLQPKEFRKRRETDIVKLISIGSLEQLYKSPDVVIKSIKLLSDKKINCRLTWVGDGAYKERMIALSKDLGVFDKVLFIGKVVPSKVREYLLDSDIFILVSRSEGLPRAVIEAMSVGLPCIGTRIGGIPELLENEVLIKPNDEYALADEIDLFVNNSTFVNMQAKRNLLESRKYAQSLLEQKRQTFYKSLIKLSNSDDIDKR
ncbi:MAG: glycosyltransferase [Prevotella sp.]|jgi:glycosyltransferase involved in cell wall biosynthesis|nr:glycosyltransferase [Prevotella sp.]